ncbi:MAG: hypothetical protein A2Z88_02120 [Omnitrophica WOR_2 bacterium GWA2_47_8]|nr:MAG: hypothetical protein A2Z88_02120 [Omnitrophica WOR_2 bacterium GWA2_47_8]
MGYVLPIYLGRDKAVGFCCSLAAHAGLLLVGGLALIKPVEFGVETGLAGFEVELIAGAPERVVVQPPVPVPIEEIVKEKDPVVEEKTPIAEEIGKVTEEILAQAPQNEGNSSVNALQSQKAIQARASYLKNPAPYYPLEARQKGWEGLVLLEALVDIQGSAIELKILRSSGHSVLDHAAMKAVKNWKFNPARMGSVPIESLVQIPIRFYLETF